MALTLLTGLTVWAATGRERDRGGKGAGGGGAFPFATAPAVPVRVVGGVEEKLVGTWVECTLISKKRLESETDMKADGTFEARCRLISIKDGTHDIKMTGTWRVQEKLLISKIETEDWDQEELPGYKLNQLMPGGKILAGQTVTEEIVSVSDTNLVTRNPKTGETSTAERKRR